MSGKLLVNPPPDAEDWLQCWTCGYIIAVREAQRKEGYRAYWELSLSIILMITARGTILGNDSKNRYQKLKQRKNKHPDKEIQKYLDEGMN